MGHPCTYEAKNHIIFFFYIVSFFSRMPATEDLPSTSSVRATNSNGDDVSNMLNTDFELLYHLDLDPTTFEAGCEVNVVSPLKAE